MNVIKRLIRFLFNLLGLQIVTMDAYNSQRYKINEIINKANTYYKESLECKADSLTDPEYLQLLELKYGGYVFDIKRVQVSPKDSRSKGQIESGGMIGGDRMNVLLHDYSSKYSEYLMLLRKSESPIQILEVGILKGTGLAVWSEYFNKKVIYGFDYDLGNFEGNKNNLIELGAFKDGLPITKLFDQFADNSKILRETFGDKKLDVIIDDAFHSDETIINTFNEMQSYLSDNFVYFIEDNKTAWKKLQAKYPQYKFDYNNDGFTVVKMSNKF
jgi:hypothetical protein